MHPHVRFFDRLATRMDKQDPQVARILVGIRDQVDAAVKANQVGRIRLGHRKSLDSVLRSVTHLMEKYSAKYPSMANLLGRFVSKVQRTETLT